MSADETTGSEQTNVWPLPKFYFSVEFDGLDGAVAFQEVTGLDAQDQVVEYRSGNSPIFSTVKMPGLAKFGNVTLKMGVFPADSDFWTWFNMVKMNTIERREATIRLMAESGAPTMIWRLANAWPCKITGTDLKSDGNEIALEAIELAHEGLTIENV